MTKTYFVTGTDTDVGKTLVSAALLQAASLQGLSTLAYKPIAAGCATSALGLRNEDALILQKYSSINVHYELINPIAFKEPIAPHLAAVIENKPIDLNCVSVGLQKLQDLQADVLIVEGAGGWHLPINHQQLLSQWVSEQNLAVILVVGMKLGCLNHALLTYQAILKDGLQVVGWVANQLVTEMPCYEQNLHYLKQKIDAPLIAQLPSLAKPYQQNLAPYINFKFT
ncbi:MAG: dethiobiotin synthase [Psychromonas sp.]